MKTESPPKAPPKAKPQPWHKASIKAWIDFGMRSATGRAARRTIIEKAQADRRKKQ